MMKQSMKKFRQASKKMRYPEVNNNKTNISKAYIAISLYNDITEEVKQMSDSILETFAGGVHNA